jgi:hypothetical protein
LVRKNQQKRKNHRLTSSNTLLDMGKAGVESRIVTLQSLDDESETVANDIGGGKNARVYQSDKGANE